MPDLITGHQGVNHITAEQVATLNRILMGNFGLGKVVRMKDGTIEAETLSVVIHTGYWRIEGIDMEVQEEDTILLDPIKTAGASRIDDIYVEVLKDIATGNERSEVVIIMGNEDYSPVPPAVPTRPENVTDDLLLAVKLARCTVADDDSMTMEDYSVAYNVSVNDLGLSVVNGKLNITYNE